MRRIPPRPSGRAAKTRCPDTRGERNFPYKAPYKGSIPSSVLRSHRLWSGTTAGPRMKTASAAKSVRRLPLPWRDAPDETGRGRGRTSFPYEGLIRELRPNSFACRAVRRSGALVRIDGRPAVKAEAYRRDAGQDVRSVEALGQPLLAPEGAEPRVRPHGGPGSRPRRCRNRGSPVRFGSSTEERLRHRHFLPRPSW